MIFRKLGTLQKTRNPQRLGLLNKKSLLLALNNILLATKLEFRNFGRSF